MGEEANLTVSETPSAHVIFELLLEHANRHLAHSGHLFHRHNLVLDPAVDGNHHSLVGGGRKDNGKVYEGGGWWEKG